jgi:hypothetical protein
MLDVNQLQHLWMTHLLSDASGHVGPHPRHACPDCIIGTDRVRIIPAEHRQNARGPANRKREARVRNTL